MKKRNGLFLMLATAGFSFAILSSASAQNCPVTVNAGPDATLCAPGNTTLTATTAGGTILSSQWTPATGLPNAASLSTTANVSATTTYSILVRSLSPTNLVVNGNFNQGNTGFDTDYTYDSGASIGILENEYAIVSNSGQAHNQFADCEDHTGDTPGNMMTVNGSGQSNNVWCQTIAILPNTEYQFSAWACSAVSQNPARLRFSINGQQIGNVYMASSNTCNWTQFNATWTSGNITSATICIVNVNTTASGNDFSLDDISFRQICQTTDEVTITVANLNASWTNPGPLCSNAPSITLNSLLTANATPGGIWTIDGMINNPITILNPAALAPGAHSLRYLVTLGTCNEELTQAVTIQPARTAGQPLAAHQVCANTPLAISLGSLLQGEDPGGVWSETSATPSSGGAFNAASGTFNTTTQLPGTYTFRYFIDATAPCADVEATVTVVINPLPVADAGADQELDCTVVEVSLGGPNTTPGLTYDWSDTSGVPLNLPDAPVVQVTKSATYTLTVFDPATGCLATDEVTVISTVAQISAELTATPVACGQPSSGVIEVVNASGGEAPYLYQLNDGTFSVEPVFGNLTAGDYTVVVQDANGCETTLTQTLTAPSEIAVEISSASGTSLSLGDSTRLTALANIPADQIASIQWNPAIPGCDNCSSAFVLPLSNVSTYQVVVTDMNGCSATDEISLYLTHRLRLFIPTAFSPNDDGYNDRFFVQAGNDLRIIRNFRVWDRWGDLLFERQNFQANDPDFGWDGKSRGRFMKPALYVYSIEFELLNGDVIQEKGEVSLLR